MLIAEEVIDSYRPIAEKKKESGLTTSTNIQNYFVDFSNGLVRKLHHRCDDKKYEFTENNTRLLRMTDEKIKKVLG
jgi:hypothetical protein